MTDATIVAFGGALATVIASIGSLLLSWRAAERANLAAERAEAIKQKTDALLTKTAEIHTLANDNFSTSQASLAVANQKIQGLEALLAATKPKDKVD